MHKTEDTKLMQLNGFVQYFIYIFIYRCVLYPLMLLLFHKDEKINQKECDVCVLCVRLCVCVLV